MEDTQSYRERLGQRNAQESILRDLGSSQDLASLLSRSGSMLRKALNADGLIVVHGDKDIFTDGHTPPAHKISRLIYWASESSPLSTVHTDRLPELLPEFEEHRSIASGIVYARIDIDKPMHFLWLRAEQLQRVEWAGNPHKSDATGPSSALTPRGSFDAWTETVRGRSHPWTRGQIETATRISKSVGEAHQHLRTRALNSDLTLALRDNQILLQQKDDVLLEANHRIQNSLALVGAFLRMQLRSSDDRPAAEVISEAQRRINAIGLVHRRLHQPDSAQRVDLARYLQELVEDMMQTGDSNWIDDFSFDLFPVDVSSGTAVGVGLILNELVTNVQKYAYGGSPGPVKITLRPAGDGFKLTVDDRGIGKDGSVRGGGFGTAIMKAMVQRIEATISEKDNKPGLSTTILAATGAIGLDKTLADE
nr:histidine kinase dimerization/phosphoacceptor domain -containing protein [Salipiger sp. PrR002]